MRSQIIIFLFILGIWVFTVVFFRSLKMDFFKFIAGSIGLFAITIIFFREPLETILVDSLSYILQSIGQATKSFKVIPEYAIVLMEGRNGGILNMSITYQCSGVIELLVFSSLALFFPFISYLRKIYVLVFGNLFLFICNVIRILFIIFVVRIVGVDAFEFTHMVLGRILFFGLTVILYYKVFTVNQLKKQRVGEVR